MKNYILLALLLLCVFAPLISCRQKVHCYYTNWSQYREVPAKFFPENVDVDLCDTLIFSFAQITDHKLVSYEWNDEAMWPRAAALKNKKPSLKILLAVGGWNQASYAFSPMVSTAQNRRIFIQSAVNLLTSINFDGLDLDWEYPGARGGGPSDKANLVLLCKELREEFNKYNLMLTLAIGAGPIHVAQGYDLPNLAKYVDHIGVMTYDFFVCSNPTVEHQSYLHGRAGMQNPEFTTARSMSMMESHGVPVSKLVVGLPLYGRGFRSSVSQNPSFGDRSSGYCPAALPYTKEGGIASYYEICNLIKQGYKQSVHKETKMPYVHDRDVIYGYDDGASLYQKVKWAQSKGYGGVMTWALDFDDFQGSFCNQGSYPLMRSIYRAINNNDLPTDSTTRSTTTTTTTRGTSVCQPGQNYYADKSNQCQTFFACSTGSLAGTCPAGTLFSNSLQVCDWAANVVC